MSQIREVAQHVLKDVAKLEPIERINAAKALFDDVRELEADVAAIRRTGVRDLRSSGWTLKEIAAEIGMSWQRVRQIEIGD